MLKAGRTAAGLGVIGTVTAVAEVAVAVETMMAKLKRREPRASDHEAALVT